MAGNVARFLNSLLEHFDTMHTTLFLFISGPEIIVILLIVVMLFGADKIPEIARGMGKVMRQVKDATNDIKQEIKDSAEGSEVVSDIKEQIDEGKKEIEEIKNTIRRNTDL